MQLYLRCSLLEKAWSQQNRPSAELGSTAVQKYRGTVTRYFFSAVIGTVDTF